MALDGDKVIGVKCEYRTVGWMSYQLDEVAYDRDSGLLHLAGRRAGAGFGRAFEMLITFR